MNKNYSRHALSAFILLLAIVACALPGQTIQPAPVTNPNAVETAVAGTALAAEKQTQQANLVPPTATIAPTITMTPAPKISSAGTSLLNLADGSTQFTDHVAGMQVVFPPGWLLVRVGELEYYAAWERQESTNRHFRDIFTDMQDLDPKAFRVHALDIRPEHMANDDIPLVVVVFVEGDTKTLDEIKKIEIEDHPPLTAYKLLSSNSFETSQGIQALSTEIQWQSAEENRLGYRKRVIFKVPGGSMGIDLLIFEDEKEIMRPEFEQLINTVVLFTP